MEYNSNMKAINQTTTKTKAILIATYYIKLQFCVDNELNDNVFIYENMKRYNSAVQLLKTTIYLF